LKKALILRLGCSRQRCGAMARIPTNALNTLGFAPLNPTYKKMAKVLFICAYLLTRFLSEVENISSDAQY
jgi:hypothetical protein